MRFPDAPFTIPGHINTFRESLLRDTMRYEHNGRLQFLLAAKFPLPIEFVEALSEAGARVVIRVTAIGQGSHAEYVFRMQL